MPRYFISLHPIRLVSILSVCVAALTIILSPVNSALADSSPPAGGNYYQGIVISYQISECYDAPLYCQNLMGVNWQSAQTLVPEDIAAVDSHIGLGTDEPPWIYYGTWTCQSESPWAWEGIVGPVGNPPRDAWFYMPSGYYFRCTSNGVNAPSPRWLVGSVDIGCSPGDKLSHQHPGWCERKAKYELSITANKPFIPLFAAVDKHRHVLTRSALKLLVTKDDSLPVSGIYVPIRSDRGSEDKIQVGDATDSQGYASGYAETRKQPGTSTLTSASATIATAEAASISWLPAKYIAPNGVFEITCYRVALEKKDTAGPMVVMKGIPGKHHYGFESDTIMQGSGRTNDGHWIKRLNRVWRYVPCPYGAAGALHCATKGKTVAVDKRLIPMSPKYNIYGHISISGIGTRTAQDTGGGIKIYHIDVFGGRTAEAYPYCKNFGVKWRAVTFLGYVNN